MESLSSVVPPGAISTTYGPWSPLAPLEHVKAVVAWSPKMEPSEPLESLEP